MRKGLIAIVIAAILLAGAALSWRVLRWRAQETSPKSGGRVSLVSVAEEKALPPLPNISLQINSEHELTEYQGTPLIFTVRLSNPRAVNAEAANQAERIHAEELQARVARGETGKEQASAQLASFRGSTK